MKSLRSTEMPAAMEVVADIAGARDRADFGRRAVEAIPRLIPGHHVSYNAVDLRTSSGEVVFAPADAWNDELLEAFLAHAGEHPLIRECERSGTTEPLVLSRVTTSRALERTGLHAEVFRPLDVRDQLAFSVAAEPGHVVGIAISRPRPTFSEREVDLLAACVPAIAAAYRSAIAAERAALLRDGLVERHEALGRALVVVDARGRIDWCSPLAERLMRRYLGGGQPGSAWLGRHGARREDGSGSSTAGDVLARRGPAALRLTGRSELRDGRVLFELQEDDPAAELARVRALGLTRRQAEVLLLCAGGLSNSAIGARLRVSERTVHRHLADGYRRIGVRSRSAATRAVLAAIHKPAPASASPA